MWSFKKNQNETFRMSEILKQNLVLNVMKIERQSAAKLSEKFSKRNHYEH